MLVSVAKDAYLSNHSKTTHYAQNYLPIVLFFQNFLNKASRLLFIFIRVSMGHTHFSNNKIHISWVPVKPSTVFFSCRMPENSTRKAGLKVCGWLLCPVFNLEKKPTFELKLTCI